MSRAALLPEEASVWRVALALLSLVAALPTAAEPRTPRSHEAALEVLAKAEGAAFENLLAEYDAYLAARPNDVAVQVERCRFLGMASCDEYDECPYWEQHEACVAELEERFSGVAVADLYRLEQLWDEPAIELGQALLDDSWHSWQAPDLAQVHMRLALLYRVEEQPELVLEHARRAMELNPSFDQTLIAARAFIAQDRRSDAIRMLVSRPIDPAHAEAELQKIGLLGELGAWQDAERSLDQLGNVPDDLADPLVEARVYLHAGRADEARAALERAQGLPMASWRQREIARERFELELVSGDTSAAASAYAALREQEWSDPIFRERLRLAFHHPDAPWRSQDTWGLLGVVGLLLGTGGAMAALLIPIHYVGLIRGRRHPDRVPGATRFGLRHCWYALCLLVVSGFPLLYLDGFRWFDDFLNLNLDPAFDAPIPDRTLVHAMLLSAVLGLVGLLPLLRRSDLALLGPGRWTWTHTVKAALLWLLAVRFATLAWAILFPEVTQHLTGMLPELPAFSYTLQGLRAIARIHGVAALVLVAVVAAPLVEEILFRGVLLQGFGRYLPAWLANVLQAGIFTAMHDQLSAMPILFLVALAAGSMARRSQGLAGPMLMHASHNALAVYAIAKGVAPS